MSCIDNVCYEVLILPKHCLKVQAYFEWVLRLAHYNAHSVVILEFRLDKVNTLEPTKHVVKWH